MLASHSNAYKQHLMCPLSPTRRSASEGTLGLLGYFEVVTNVRKLNSTNLQRSEKELGGYHKPHAIDLTSKTELS